MECPICLDTIQESYSSPCGHNMCQDCFSKWRDEQVQKCCSVTCPTCRFVIIEVASVIKIDIFTPPRGYIEVDETHINSPRAYMTIPFPSMPEDEYNEMFEDELAYDDDCEEEDNEDWDEKDDWEYEDVDNYIVATYAY